MRLNNFSLGTLEVFYILASIHLSSLWIVLVVRQNAIF